MNSLSIELDHQLEELLDEGIEGARRREADAFDELAGANVTELVLFGAGNLGRRTLTGLRRIGIEPLCFIDNNKARWGEKVDGLLVLSPEEGGKLYGDHATFIVTVWGALGSDRMASRIAQLRQLGCRSVVSFLPLYWKFGSVFLPHYTLDLPHHLHAQADRVRQGFRLMADDASRQEYLAQLRFRLLGDFGCLPAPVPGAIYFRDDLFTLGKEEILVDCGGFDGDSLSLFLEKVANEFRSAIVFEPDPANFMKLSGLVDQMPFDIRRRITLHQAATGEINERVMMEVGSGPSSQIGKGDQEVESFALDSLLEDVPVTFIKMDIEGSELATLAGAKKLIQKNTPILAISAYHRQDDLWNIPLLIRDLNPDYSFQLRPHMIEGWDLVCYAVPSNR
jgi:FkbM family methyltransferase